MTVMVYAAPVPVTVTTGAPLAVVVAVTSAASKPMTEAPKLTVKLTGPEGTGFG